MRLPPLLVLTMPPPMVPAMRLPPLLVLTIRLPLGVAPLAQAPLAQAQVPFGPLLHPVSRS